MNNVINLDGIYDFRGQPKIINLDDWKWLRELSGNDINLVEQYKEQARKNEIIMVQIYGKDAWNIYVPELIAPTEQKEHKEEIC